LRLSPQPMVTRTPICSHQTSASYGYLYSNFTQVLAYFQEYHHVPGML
jgi:hypothetical protein